MNYKKFKVVGLQRSGTNWIAALISKNFVVQEDLTTTFWKHLTPMGVKNTQECSEPFYQLENFVIRPDTFYVATKKNFQLWTESIKRKPMDTHRTHIGSLDQIHDSWCGWAKDQSSQENFFYKDYLRLSRMVRLLARVSCTNTQYYYVAQKRSTIQQCIKSISVRQI